MASQSTMWMMVIGTIIISVASSVNALSSCDVHTSGDIAGTTSSSYLVYQCSSGSLPFTTEAVAISYQVTSADETVRVGVTSGSDCTSYGAFYTALSCGLGSSAAVYTCVKTGYTVIDGETNWCMVIVGSSGEATVDVDLEFTPASYYAQWHLNNTGQFGGTSGNDVNATGAWSQGALGNSVVVMVVDTGVQSNHVEVADRFVSSLSWNPQTGARDPTPGDYEDDHGTGCAGVAAAAINGYCGQGAAPQASIAGFRLFGDSYSGSTAGYVRGLYYDETASDGRRVSISTNSWGPYGCSSSGCYFASTSPPIVASIQYGADTGRLGKGVVYAFAAGNEGYYGGDANMYAYCKLPEVMCIAGSDFNGKRVYYSNSGANLFVNSPTQGQYDATKGLFPSIITAQYAAGTSNCMNTFGGTSSSTPLVAGIVATILGVRPDLTYRDVQHIIQKTADRNDPTSSQWFQNAAGVWFSHHHGFGRINAGNAVSLAKTWTLLGGVTGVASDSVTVGSTIPDNSPSTPVVSTITFAAGTENLPDTIEHVTAYVTIVHNAPHDLRIKLTSPSGTVANLTTPQKTVQAGVITLYPLAARVFWGESPVGIWKIAITDERATVTGSFSSWSMEVQGSGNGTLPDRVSTGLDLSDDAPLSTSITMMVTIGAMIIGMIMTMMSL